ncbi:MAG: hypothetical protein FD189_2074 [Elusimicrobia bacterium]|nr:MAG: hypothetical protein FD189_2074 [Elusimicrobiota bacterium]
MTNENKNGSYGNAEEEAGDLERLLDERYPEWRPKTLRFSTMPRASSEHTEALGAQRH